MQKEDLFKKAGMNAKEASVYSALLELGTSSASSIASKAGIKRPTAYLVLDELKRKGLVSIYPKSGKKLFNAESPEYLLRDLKNKQELFTRYLPGLLADFSKKRTKSAVQLFLGEEGLRKVYDKVFSSDKILFFGNTSETLKIFPESADILRNNVEQKNIIVKDILSGSESDRKFTKTMAPYKNYSFKFCSKPFPNDNAIFGDSVVFFSFHPEISALMITDREVSQAMRILHEIVWESLK